MGPAGSIHRYPHFLGCKDTMQFWNELEGQTIDGQFPLRRLVRSEGRSAWFESETSAAQPERATISLTEVLTDADEVAGRLQAAQGLKHPNLVTITQVGQVRIDNTQVVYAVMESIEQSLSDVLQSQALSAEEGREVAEALVGALTAIHQKGMSHGHVEAASVLATEATVKLRSDCLQTNAASQADDVAGVGRTLFHAFTQRKAVNATDALVNRIPAPFAEIVRNTLARRWSLAQIAIALKPAPPVPATIAPAPTVSVPQVDALPVKAPEPVAVQPPLPLPPTPDTVKTPPPVAAKVAPAMPKEEAPDPATPKRRPIALYGAVAVVVLPILCWVLLRPHEAPAPTAAPTVTQPPAVAPSKPSAVAVAPLAAPGVANAMTDGHATRGKAARTIWRVVVYTYRGQTKAADSVARINGAHPDLNAAVFNPARSEVYMVVLGGAMDRPQAIALLAKARREGLPQDTFVRNFSE